MENKKTLSLQEWLPFDALLDRGMILLKDQSYAKMIKVIPINYHLKSDLEKLGILNSYQTFLKTCNFDIQILIQSNKEDISKHISQIKEKVKQENNVNLFQISEKYINFITRLNNKRKSSSKNFYIIIKTKPYQEFNKTQETIAISELSENYFKIKECLARCGNSVLEISEKAELKQILFTFFNARKNFLR